MSLYRLPSNLVAIVITIFLSLGLLSASYLRAADDNAGYIVIKRQSIRSILTQLTDTYGLKIAYVMPQFGSKDARPETARERLEELQAIPENDRTDDEKKEIEQVQKEIDNPSPNAPAHLKIKDYSVKIPRRWTDSAAMEEARTTLDTLDDNYQAVISGTLIVFAPRHSAFFQRSLDYKADNTAWNDIQQQLNDKLKRDRISIMTGFTGPGNYTTSYASNPLVDHFTLDIHDATIAQGISQIAETFGPGISWRANFMSDDTDNSNSAISFFRLGTTPPHPHIMRSTTVTTVIIHEDHVDTGPATVKRATLSDLMGQLTEHCGLKIAYVLAPPDNDHVQWQTSSEKLEEMQNIPEDDRSHMENEEIARLQKEVDNSGQNQIKHARYKLYSITLPRDWSGPTALDDVKAALDALDDHYESHISGSIIIYAPRNSPLFLHHLNLQADNITDRDLSQLLWKKLDREGIQITSMMYHAPGTEKPLSLDIHDVTIADGLCRIAETLGPDISWQATLKTGDFTSSPCDGRFFRTKNLPPANYGPTTPTPKPTPSGIEKDFQGN